MKPDWGERTSSIHENEPAGLIVANLDCEHAWLRQVGGPGLELGRQARRRAAILAAGLQVFSRSGRDRVWTPAAVEAEVWGGLPNRASPARVDGSVTGEYDHVLPWGETVAIAELREHHVSLNSAPASEIAAHANPDAAGSNLRGPALQGRELPYWLCLLWETENRSATTAAQVNDRGFALEVARRHGCSLPGETMIESVEEFEAWIAAGGIDASASRQWILRQPYSAAGRGRLIGRATGGLDQGVPGARQKLESMLKQQGRLHCAPFMDRIDDWGLVGIVSDRGTVRIGWHQQKIRGVSAFAGLTLGPGRRWPSADEDGHQGLGHGTLDAEAQGRLSTAFNSVGNSLWELGYRGPFGLDAWRYRDPTGRTRLHVLGEINGRLTMGHVAWAFVDRFADELGWNGADEVRLRIDRVEDSWFDAEEDRRRWRLAAWQDRGSSWAMWMEAR